MSKGGKVPHDKMNIPNYGKQKFNNVEKTNAHVHDTKQNTLHTHGLKAKSSTRAPNHSQKNGQT